MRDEPTITNVYSFTNGMTAVFDQHGQQMPEFQGRTEDVMLKIRAAGYTPDVPLASWHAVDTRRIDRQE
jgi:hypothetical protein